MSFMLHCPPFGLCYMGKTNRSIKIRIAEHQSIIRLHDPRSPVAQHFVKFKHSVSTLQYIGIEAVKLL